MTSSGAIHVACAADEAYVEHSAAMLHSVLVNGGGSRVHVHYLHGSDLTESSIERLTGMVEGLGGEISFFEVSGDHVATLPLYERFPPAMWYRILLPEVRPELDRVLYLDVDTIAVDDLNALWDMDLAGHYLAAVTNVFQPNHRHRPEQLGLAGPEAYFNSGVVLMNLESMRRDDCSRALRDFAESHRGELEWPDQDALNVVLGAGRLALHPRWNCMNSVMHFPWSEKVFGPEATAEARSRPGIRHFEGPTVNKPWHYLCARDMREVYWEHRRETPWPERHLEGVSLRNAARNIYWRARPRARPL